MDDQTTNSLHSTTVVREFAGSRLERQLLAEAFELAWTEIPTPVAHQMVQGPKAAADIRSLPLRKGA